MSRLFIVLGATHDAEGNLAREALERISAALGEFSHDDTTLLVTAGGCGADHLPGTTPHAVLLAAELGRCGLKTDLIRTLSEPHNTVQEAVHARKLVEELKPSEVAILTNDFHLPRALLIFETVLRPVPVVGRPAISSQPDERYWEKYRHEYRALQILVRQGGVIVDGALERFDEVQLARARRLVDLQRVVLDGLSRLSDEPRHLKERERD